MATIKSCFFPTQYNVQMYGGMRGNKAAKGDPVLYGIEVELENLPRTPEVLLDSEGNRLWAVTTDGSLRNDGKEFVSAPFQWKFKDTMLSSLFGFLKTTKCQATARCGTHVHMNVLDMDMNNLATYFAVYLAFEDIMFTLSGGRQKNPFCVPLLNNQIGDYAIKFILEPNKSTLSRMISACDKYAALNVKTIANIGTVEYRHCEGVTDPTYLEDWITVINNLNTIAQTTSITNIVDINTHSEYEVWIFRLLEGIKSDVMHSRIHVPTFVRKLRRNVRDLKLGLAA